MSSVLFGELRSVSTKHSFQDASGSTQLVLDSSGRLGVGTTNPTTTFHCQGNALVTGSITTSNLSVLGTTTTINSYETNSSNVVISNVSGLGPALKVTQSGGNNGNYPVADFYDGDVSTSVPALRVADGGYVGIGTTAPQTALHVVGDLTVTGGFNATGPLMFRNRVVNGNMVLDSRNAGGVVGACTSNAMTVPTVDNWYISTGQYSPSVVAQQVALSSSDQATTGQTYALQVAPVNMPNGLGAYFPFEGNLNDASGNGISLAPNGRVVYSAGKIGTNAAYLANEANVVYPSPTEATNYITGRYTFPTYFTVCMWMKPSKIVANVPSTIFITNSTTNTTNNIQVWYNTSSIRAAFWGTADTGAGSVAPAVNTWYHIAITYSNGSLYLYVNGTQNGANQVVTMAQNGFTLGNTANASPAQPFAGHIDDFRIYNRVLSLAEIAALANLTPFSPSLPSASGLVHYYPFDGSLANSGTAGGSATSSPTAVTYAPGGMVGTQSLYLANESSVSASPSAPTYYVTGTYTFPSTFTASYWVMYTKISSGCSSVSFVTNNANAALSSSVYIGTNGSTNLLNAGFWSGNVVVAPLPISNTWYHYAIVYNSGTAYFYINGAHMGSTTGTLAQSGFMLGVSGKTAAQTFAGYIDDLRIYSSALTANDIAALYYNSSATFTNLQQPIDSSAIADLAWGTSAASPATLSAWIKNNTAAAQSYTLSVNSTGLIGHLSFENTYADQVGAGFLSAPTRLTSTALSSSTYKVGSYSLNVNSNSIGSTATQSVSYLIPSYNALPLTLSLWFNANTTSGSSSNQFICVLGTYSTFSLSFVIEASTGNFYADSYVNGGTYSLIYAPSVPSVTTWYHACFVLSTTGATLYINGAVAGASSFNATYLANTLPNNALVLGSRVDLSNPFKGYIDDVRVYNRALTAAQVKALYDANAGAVTTQPTDPAITLPVRSLVYNTPSISANTWQRVSVTLPADTTAVWDTRPGYTAANIALNLGAGPSFSNATAGSWNNNVAFSGSGSQIINSSANNFLAASSNAVLLTGVQLEKGSSASSYETRPNIIDSTLLGFYKANTVAFHVISTATTNFTNGIINGFNTYLTDVNTTSTKAYNLSTGYFTCPVPGLYCFAANLFCATPSSLSFYTIRKNATQYNNGQEYGGGLGSGYMMISATAIIPLALNETVSLWWRIGTVSTTTGPYTSFSGYLITPM